ncbi:hypothetical protein D9613_005009 [Agrocybe pediades]|uniref:Uncharacterized protein n=1 Tax=Agrocybe pediades TaxID=84607 RepID=A0A8H4VTQ9_9AGAR|nr:hypothetical protein D9613_005009 [Agrocybe pediades]
MSTDSNKIPLPHFLKLLTSNNVPIPKAMAIAGKVYKEYNTPATLSTLTDKKLMTLGLVSQEERKALLGAVRKAGYTTRAKLKVKDEPEASSSKAPAQSPTSDKPLTAVDLLITPTKRKRKKVDDVNEFLPDGPPEETEEQGSHDFGEILDEDSLANVYAVINRAPVMMAWATLVAERMHFTRDEALSIASVYTEMNAITKGVSLGLYDKDKERGQEAAKGGSQPYVELMGRRPLYRSQAGQWRALSNGSPVPSGSAFSYISRAFRQRTPHILGAMKLLADSYTPQELNQNAWSLYAEFRPKVNEWGKRSEIYCKSILALRKQGSADAQANVSPIKPVHNSQSSPDADSMVPERKKARTLTVEEYEAALDLDSTFDNVNLDFLDTSKG